MTYPNVKLDEFIVSTINNKEEPKRIAYISKSTNKLKHLHMVLVEQCDIANSSSLIYGVHPIGIHLIPEAVDVAIFTKDDTSEEHLLKHLKHNKKFIIYEVKEGDVLDLTYAETP